MARVAHVISTPSGTGGAERVMASLLREGTRRGWEQLVLNPFATDPLRSELAGLCAPVPYAGHRCSRASELPGVLAWLRRNLTRFAPDIVHAHLFHALVIVAATAGRKRKLVLTHHHGNSLQFEGHRVRAGAERIAGRRFHRIVAVSRWVERYLIADAGFSSSRVVCIPNGWEGTPAARSGLASEPTIVCIANFRWQKGHDTLLRAFVSVRKSLPDAQLLLVGDGELRPALTRQAENLGVAGGVQFLGPVDDVWPVLERAHVFALASEYEPLGIAVLEAMAAGLPIVATAVGGIPELVCPEVSGVLVQPGDDKSMADALRHLLTAPGDRHKLGEAGRVAAADLHVDRMLDGYFDLYRQLL